MEAGGHYYTVYYTSLAVGFSKGVAYRHAVLSQMPDQVSWMDAAHMHIHQCTGFKVPDFNNVSREVPAGERYRMEYGLHSLPDKNLNERTRSSAYQRQQTANALLAESPISLKFGLLLHRLGDTFAHSREGNESTMYTVNTSETCFYNGLHKSGNYANDFGHGHHGHTPDYPFLRQPLFYSYLEKLYEVLAKKAGEAVSVPYKRKDAVAKQLHEVRGAFQMIFANLAKKVSDEERSRAYAAALSGGMGMVGAMPVSNELKATWFIEEVRKAALRNLGVELYRGYAPEKDKGLPLPQFLAKQRQLSNQMKEPNAGLDDLNINPRTLTDTINNMIPPRGSAGASGSW